MLRKLLYLPCLFFLLGCNSQTGYYLRNTSEYDQKVIISLGNFFEEQKKTRLQLKYGYRVRKIRGNTYKKLKSELKPKHLNSRQIEVNIPGESTLYIDAQNPGFSNVIFRRFGATDTLYYNQLKRWNRNGKSSSSFYFDLE